ncbi:putative plasma membrane protein Pth11-like [Aspergillus thermomutatus]|uniref:Rhodopsin domain-containing protein n=1 Tax=Aspergillus thermomutatus TaxID=41047 RepID=A0A397HLI2_ASPTH|nr:uncharacterized protein CDV56_104509 [Aspergillus thermomutatus]RHZ62446.1 hypothetical protein CDV56_104509 [Aspergillus thermomutatus]
MPLFSHYGDHPDSSARLSYPSLVFAIVTPLVVIARLLGRRFLSGRVGADDWTILVSCAFAVTVSIQMIIVCEWAFGKHQHEMPKELVLRTLKLYFVAQILYKINIGLTKISILLLYIRLFVHRWFLTTCWVWIGIIVSFTIGTVFSSIFQCTPVQWAFNKSIPGGGTCINMTAFWYANAAFNILSDLVLIALPVPVVVNLQLPLKSKVALCGIFAVGIFTCITSILRITTLNVATNHLDTTWNSIGSSMWTVIESNLGIICACLPALRRPLSFFFPRLFSRLHKSSAGPASLGNRSLPVDATPKKVDGWSVLDEGGSADAIVSAADGQDRAQERMHPVTNSPGRGEIRKTTRVVVRYEEMEREIELGHFFEARILYLAWTEFFTNFVALQGHGSGTVHNAMYGLSRHSWPGLREGARVFKQNGSISAVWQLKIVIHIDPMMGFRLDDLLVTTPDEYLLGRQFASRLLRPELALSSREQGSGAATSLNAFPESELVLVCERVPSRDNRLSCVSVSDRLTGSGLETSLSAVMESSESEVESSADWFWLRVRFRCRLSLIRLSRDAIKRGRGAVVPSLRNEAVTSIANPRTGEAYFHAQMYAQGDYFQISALKCKAKQYFEESFMTYPDRDSFTSAVIEVYISTAENDRGLRDILGGCSQLHA